MTLKMRLTRLEAALEPNSLDELAAMDSTKLTAWLKLREKRQGHTRYTELLAKVAAMTIDELLSLRAQMLEQKEQRQGP